MWFKVDDKFHAHRKVRALGRRRTTTRIDLAAVGLWTLAGSWSSDAGEGGFVPATWVEDHGAAHLADHLVRVQLWTHGERYGEPGYLFHDWAQHNPDAETIKTAKSEGGRLANHRRWHVNRGIRVADCDHCRISNRSETDRLSESDRIPLTRPDPTRPIPEPITDASGSFGSDALKINGHLPARSPRAGN